MLDFLAECEALTEEGAESADWTGDGIDDLVTVIINPQSDAATPETDLLIFNSTEDGYVLAYRARAAGEVRLLATDDVNLDELPDIVWIDTTCGASTCFDTINIRSWDGTEWRDWTDGTITMAYAEIRLEDIRDTAQGADLELRGGVYGSVGAGPQRARTEVWGSIDGEPYTLMETMYDPSTCLIHKVQDANDALERNNEVGFQQAREMYNEVLTDRNLTKCWDRENEFDELRSFSQFRLALVNAYQGSQDEAAKSIQQLQELYPDSLFALMGQAWLAAYISSGDIATACRTATAFAEDNPETYEGLSDYGYANPTYKAADLCPILEVETPDSRTHRSRCELHRRRRYRRNRRHSHGSLSRRNARNRCCGTNSWARRRTAGLSDQPGCLCSRIARGAGALCRRRIGRRDVAPAM